MPSYVWLADCDPLTLRHTSERDPEFIENSLSKIKKNQKIILTCAIGEETLAVCVEGWLSMEDMRRETRALRIWTPA